MEHTHHSKSATSSASAQGRGNAAEVQYLSNCLPDEVTVKFITTRL